MPKGLDLGMVDSRHWEGEGGARERAASRRGGAVDDAVLPVTRVVDDAVR
jgi:hypothetical protein